MHLRSYFRFASCALGILCCWGATAARAASISVTYSLSGTATGDPANPPLMGSATGSLLPFGSITWSDLLFPDPATSSGNGTFTITFSNGDTLVGALHEHLDFTAPTDAVPFTQTIVVTGGTGAFAGTTVHTGVPTAYSHTTTTLTANPINLPAGSRLESLIGRIN